MAAHKGNQNDGKRPNEEKLCYLSSWEGIIFFFMKLGKVYEAFQRQPHHLCPADSQTPVGLLASQGRATHRVIIEYIIQIYIFEIWYESCNPYVSRHFDPLASIVRQKLSVSDSKD
jgi:hypothetical protein